MFGDVGQARPKARICRTVDRLNLKQHLQKTMRHTLQLCAQNAKKQMVPVKDYWTGWLQKGKRNPAVIAVANNLLKQVFADVKNKCLFDRNY